MLAKKYQEMPNWPFVVLLREVVSLMRLLLCDSRMPLKDVSVTLIPLRQSHHDKIEVGDSKKVRTGKATEEHMG